MTDSLILKALQTALRWRRAGNSERVYPASRIRSRKANPLIFETLENRLLLSADITGGLLSATLLDPAVPTDNATAIVRVLNAGNQPAVPATQVAVYASLDSKLDASDVLLGTATMARLSAGQARDVNVNLAIPSALAPNPYNLLIRADARNAVAEGVAGEANNVSVGRSFDVAWKFGNVPGRAGNTALTLTDADGTGVTFSLSGPGLGEVIRDGAKWDLKVTGTTTTSILTIETKGGGNGRATIDDLHVLGPLNFIIAPSTDLRGTLAVDGALNVITIGSVNGGVIAAPSLRGLLAGSLTNATILIGATLGQDGKLSGTGVNADTFGSAGPSTFTQGLSVLGSVSGSTIRVGVDPVDGVFGNGNDVFRGGGIQYIFFGGTLSSDSRIIAGTITPLLWINGQFLTVPASDPRFSSDLAAPTLTAALALDTGASTADKITNNPTVVGKLTDNGALASFKASFGATPTFDILSDRQANGSFTLSLARLNQIHGAPLTDGTKTLTLLAIDSKGNSTRITVPFALDTRVTALTFDLATASDDPPVDDQQTTARAVTLVGRTEALAAVVLLGTTQVTTADATGAFAFANVALALGANTLTVRATDVAGNQLTFARTITRTLATTSRWINPNGGDWNVAANWSTGLVPTADQDVVIDIAVSSPIRYMTGATTIKSLASNQAVTISGGSFNVTGQGLFNSGTITIKPAGELAVTGDFVQSPAGTLAVEISGTAPLQFGRATIAGIANLDGILNVSFADNFVPTSGDRFPFITFSSRTGYFSATNVPANTAIDQSPLTDLELVPNHLPALAPIGNTTAHVGNLLQFSISATDTDVPPQRLIYAATGVPTGASFDPATQSFTWTPTKGQGGRSFDEVTFTVSDGLVTVSDMISIRVVEGNQAPMAVDDDVRIAPGTPFVDLTDAQLLANDTDPDGDALAIGGIVPHELLEQLLGLPPLHGTLHREDTHITRYTPEAGFIGVEQFGYSVVDSFGALSIAMVTLGIDPGPVASGAQDMRDAPAGAFSAPLNATDRVPGPQPLTFTLVQAPVRGTVTLDSTDGTYTYTPESSAVRTDSFQWQASDGFATSNVATQTVLFDHAPTVVDDDVRIAPGTPFVDVTDAQLLANDTDADGDALTITAVTSPELRQALGLPPLHGTLHREDTHITRYTPEAGFIGVEQFGYSVVDSFGALSIAMVTLGIDPGPVASGAQDMRDAPAGAFSAPLNATDRVPGPQPLTFTLVQAPVHGTVTLDSTDGTYTYTPESSAVRTDSFQWQASDGFAASNVATQTVLFDHAPTAVDDDVRIAPGTPFVDVTDAQLLANDTDADGDALTITAVTSPELRQALGLPPLHGTLHRDDANHVTRYIPEPGFIGAEQFGYSVVDSFGALSIALVTLNVAPLPQMHISDDVSVVEGNNGATPVPVTVTLSEATTVPVTVDVLTDDVHTIAIAGSDYMPVHQTLTFAPGETNKTLTVNVLGDTVAEDDEIVSVLLANPVNATFQTVTSSATGHILTLNDMLITIQNDDAAPVVPQMRISDDVTVAEGNSGAIPVPVTVTLSEATTVPVTVDVLTDDIHTAATAGGDYTPVHQTLTFAPGETSKTIAVDVLGDTEAEPNEVFDVLLANPLNATFQTLTQPGGHILTLNDMLVTIQNDDVAPVVPQMRISDDVSVVEGNSGATPVAVTVTLSEATTVPVMVDVLTDDAHTFATAGTDYTPVHQTLTFAPGETRKTITLDVLGDTVLEPDELVDVLLTNPLNATFQTVTLPGGSTQALNEMVITIQNDDVAPVVPQMRISDDVRLSEGNSGATAVPVTVTLSEATTVPVMVDVLTDDAHTFATAGTDYTPVHQALTFAPGETSKTLTVDVLGDALAEPDEVFDVLLANPVNATFQTVTLPGDGHILTLNDMIVTIVNDDIASGIQWINPSSGDWNTASNWSTGTVPGADDNVTIDLPGDANPIVTVSSLSVARAITSTEHLAVVTGGSLTVSDAAQITNLAISGGMATFNGATTITTLTEAGGTLTGSGEVTLSGAGAAASTWSGGAMSGSGTTVITGELDSGNDANDPTLGRKLILGDGITPASMTLSGTGTLSMQDPGLHPGTLIVRDRSSLNLASDTDLVWTDGHGAVSFVTVDAGGSIVKSGAGTIADLSALILTNNGMIDVQSGTLRLMGSRCQTQDGSFNVASGATLVFDGPDIDFTGNGGITGNGTLEVEASLEKTGAGTTTTISPTVNISGGVGAGSGTLVLTGTVTNNNAMGVDAGATMIVSGTLTNYDQATQTLKGGQFWVRGTMRIANADVVVNAAEITLDGPASQLLNDTTGADAFADFTGQSGAFSVFHLTNGRNFTASGAFTNQGELEIGPGSTLTVPTRFTSDGPLVIFIGGTAPSEFGRLVVTGDPGEVVIDLSGLQIQFVGDFVPRVGDRFQFMTFASRTGYFTATHLPSGTLVDQSDLTDLELVFDPFAAGLHWINPAGGDWSDPSNWANGTVPGPDDDVFIDAPGTYTVTLGSGDIVANSITTDHPISLTGGTLTVNGTLQLTDTVLTLDGGTLIDAVVEARSVSGTASFIGVLVPTGGNAAFDRVQLNSFDGLATTRVQVEVGATLTVRNGLDAPSAAASLLSVGGTVVIEDAQPVNVPVMLSGGTLLAAASGDTLTLGSLAVVSGTGTLGSSTTRVLNAGQIFGPRAAEGFLTLFNLTNTGLLSSGTDGLTLVVSGSLINQGTLELRSSGGIQVNGNFTNRSSGQVEVKFFRSIDLGLLQIAGTATLDGTLTVLNAIAGEPTQPLQDPFMIFASRSGFFAATTFNDIDPPFTATVDQSDPTRLRLVMA